jgi:CheY-like chemotaxis protein
LAFLDIGMPGMNDYELAQGVRSVAGADRAMLVALTGWGSDADVGRATAAGFEALLTKPANPSDFDQILSAVNARLNA